GPVAGLIVVLIKDVIGMTHSTSMMVGELADFLCSGAFVVVSALIYKKHRNFKGALISMGVGIVVMTIVGALANYFIMIPFYINQMNFPEEAVIGMMAAVIPAVDSVFKLVLMVTAPFNVLKGVVLCVLTLLMYKRLSHLLHG
ncbi:MAG: ECF transporter S component, partial [Clostridia bacterium]